MGLLNSLNTHHSTLPLPHNPFELVIFTITTLLAGVVLWILVDYTRVLRLRRRMPPGPFPLPLFGNFFAIPKVKPWLKFEQWAKDYDNPLTTIWNGHRPVVMCNDCWTVSDLLEKRANIYSSRPHMVVMGDMLNATTENQHSVVGSQAVRNHRDFQSNESKLLTLDLLERPADYVMAIERYSCSVVSIIGWGRRIAQVNDYVARLALEHMETVDFVMPGLFIMEAIPLLSRLPGWLYALPSAIYNGALHGQRYFYALTKEAQGARADNFAKRMLAEQETHGLSNAEVAGMTANLIGGGVDTTSGSTITFLLAMCVSPEVQARAHEELDRVVGRTRSPTFADEEHLPYIGAIVNEALRWRTVTILGGIPHAPTVDDTYRGYLIPKDTAVTGNVWAIHRHPRDFPDPDGFHPKRFLGVSGADEGWSRPYPNKKGHNAFGWGRRQCSGQPLAEQGLFMTIARMLWAFEIRPGLDEKGNEVKLDIFAYTKSENMRPEPFQARFIPRSERIAEILREEARVAREELRVYDGETKLTMENVK